MKAPLGSMRDSLGLGYVGLSRYQWRSFGVGGGHWGSAGVRGCH